MIYTVILFLVVLSLLVLAHEWGHYFVAKKSGMKVEEFGIGFPPRLFTWKGKDGMTWSLNWIPIGGFVKVKGESGDAADEHDSFASKSFMARFGVLIAGVAMNMLVAAVLLIGGFLIGLPSVTDGGVPAGATIENQEIQFMEVLSGTPADTVGIEMGDVLTSIDGQTFTTGEEARAYLASVSDNEIVEFHTLRDGEELNYSIAPDYIEEIDGMGIGVAIVETGTVRYPLHLAIVHGVEVTAAYTVGITAALWEIVSSLITGAESQLVEEVSGPVGIAVMTGEVAEMGLAYLLQFAALLSINLAIINVLPLPALDGGRLLFLFIEAVRGKKTDERIEAVVHNLGFAFLIGIIVLVTYRDIVNLF